MTKPITMENMGQGYLLMHYIEFDDDNRWHLRKHPEMAETFQEAMFILDTYPYGGVIEEREGEWWYYSFHSKDLPFEVGKTERYLRDAHKAVNEADDILHEKRLRNSPVHLTHSPLRLEATDRDVDGNPVIRVTGRWPFSPAGEVRTSCFAQHEPGLECTLDLTIPDTLVRLAELWKGEALKDGAESPWGLDIKFIPIGARMDAGPDPYSYVGVRVVAGRSFGIFYDRNRKTE